ncbi:28S rRNA (cytosine-C(5))-methyltransferase [Eupeodes corollae]|uniref:28S rRNA (cytosine-C(5))-methyltransferase n=1 Tax=Eupeodes corollae TaxID=290404 RepID=UPI0024924050|nr:28S rRNA (cytosine-C(5))-methyltransferase [Eupeodes corollae]
MSGFIHSVKVPTQYKRVAAVLKKSLDSNKSLKTLIFEEKHARTGGMQAVLKLYIDNRAEIDHAIEQTKILEENPRLGKELCIILVTELLLGRKEIKGESKPVTTVREYKEKLLAALGGEQGVQNKTKKEISKPRYVRVNTNVLSMDKAFQMLEEEEWIRNDAKFETYPEYLEAICALKENEYLVDMHVDNLLVFHPSKKRYWACHNYVYEKKFLLQDKGTCLVAEILRPPPGSTVLDMCAAPGMKTIHLSNVMQNNGKIYSVEQSSERYRTLCEMVEAAKATIVEPINADALRLDGSAYDAVEYILIDPSCSGSGMQNRLSFGSNEKDPARLNKLAGLQIKMLSHAMTAFPNVKRVAYSTCSIYEEENEEVVQRCLQLCPQFKLLSGKKALRNKWIGVGNPEFKNIGKYCIYSRPKEDYTDGIFMAFFERRRDEDQE